MAWKKQEVRYIDIEGMSHAIGISRSAHNAPVLLYIHGGPGGTMMPNAHVFQNGWDKLFTVVHWDQRGAGKTFRRNFFHRDRSKMTILQFVEDAVQVTRFLLNYFGKKKIVILGHSWGSALATFLCSQHPEFFYAYVGVGQVTDVNKTEKYIHNYLLKKAIESNKHGDVKKLNKLGDPRTWNSFAEKRSKIFSHRIMLHHYGAVFYGETSTRMSWLPVLTSPDYNGLDKLAYFLGLHYSGMTIGREIVDINLEKTHTSFEIPMFYFLGRHDHITPSSMASVYFEKISTPQKKLIWFENAAHEPNWSQPADFQEALKNHILPICDRFH